MGDFGLFFKLSNFCFPFPAANIGGPNREVDKLGCEGRQDGERHQSGFMKNLFVRYQNRANCHRWQLFGRRRGGNLFCLLVYLFVVMVGKKGGNPPTQLASGCRAVGGQVAQRRSVTGSSLLPPGLGGGRVCQLCN